MGSPQSKVAAPRNVDTQTNMVEESSGTHFLEIHAPTAGLGFFTIFALLLSFICLYGLYRKCKRHTQRRPRPASTFPMGMALPQPDPLQAYCQLLLLQQLQRPSAGLPTSTGDNLRYLDQQRFTLLDEGPPAVPCPPSAPGSVLPPIPSSPFQPLPPSSTPRLSDPPISLA